MGWAKVAAHADGAFPWNERVDALAARGTQCEAEAAGGLGEDWAAVRLDGPLHPLRAMRARWAAVRVVVTRARGLLTVAETVTWAGAEEWHVAPGASPAAGEPAGEGDVPEVLRIERALQAVMPIYRY